MWSGNTLSRKGQIDAGKPLANVIWGQVRKNIEGVLLIGDLNRPISKPNPSHDIKLLLKYMEEQDVVLLNNRKTFTPLLYSDHYAIEVNLMMEILMKKKSGNKPIINFLNSEGWENYA